MDEADKENFTPTSAGKKASKPPLATAPINSASPRTSTRLPLGSTAFAFPTEHQEEIHDVVASNDKTLRSKRSALFYPSAGLAAQSNQKPFSRSAARRDSIMALGSIGYLQHLYTKQGIASRKRPFTKGTMTLAIGRAGEAMVSSSPGSHDDTISEASSRDRSISDPVTEEPDEVRIPDLPPSPMASTYTRPKFLDVARPLEADPDALRTLLTADLNGLVSLWRLADWIAQDPSVTTIKDMLSEGPQLPPSSASSCIDLLEVIDVTTKAIRSVRSYVLACPQRSRVPTTSPNEPVGRNQFRRQTSFSGVSRPGQVGDPVPTRTSEILHHGSQLSSSRPGQSSTSPVKPLVKRPSMTECEVDDNHLGTVRKAALEMLSALKEMEQRYRTERLSGNEVDGDPSPFAANSDGPETASNDDPDTSSVIVLAKAVSDTGYLYRSDLRLSDLATEQKILRDYLVVVNSVLTSLTTSPKDRRRLSSSATGSEQDAGSAAGKAGVGNDTTPLISLESANGFDASGSTHAWIASTPGSVERLSSFLIDHCQACGPELAQRLERVRVAAGDLEKLLPTLSDGYLLCRIFNEVVRRSDKPWGYISAREMHDLEAEEAALLHKEAVRARQAAHSEATTFQTRVKRSDPSEVASTSEASEDPVEGETRSTRPGWTFRKTENLRVWATALKLRYQIQTTATRATPAKPTTTGPTYGSLGMGKLALHGRRVASESFAPPSDSEHRSSSKTIDFDPVKVARKDAGWQKPLIKLLHVWIDAVAQEQSV